MISAEEFAERLCKLGADRGPRRFPRGPRDRDILMRSIVLGLDSAREYSEREINAALRSWNRELAPAIEIDHVTLRRLLVDHGQLERTADGARYREERKKRGRKEAGTFVKRSNSSLNYLTF